MFGQERCSPGSMIGSIASYERRAPRSEMIGSYQSYEVENEHGFRRLAALSNPSVNDDASMIQRMSDTKTDANGMLKSL